MAWGDVKKEDLVKLGLDPDKIAAMDAKLTKAATTDDVNEIKSAVTTTQNTLRELQNTLQTLAAKGGEHKEGDNGGQSTERKDGQQGGTPGPLNIDPLQFMEDPTGSVRRLMSESLTPVTLHTLNVAAEMSYNMARQRLPHFERFEPEIKELWQKYTPTQKTKPDELIENLYNLVRGRHLDEIMTDTNKKEGKYNLVQSGGSSIISRPGGEGGSGRKPEDDLTPKELEVAARFGLTPEEWAKQKGGLKYV